MSQIVSLLFFNKIRYPTKDDMPLKQRNEAKLFTHSWRENTEEC